ISVPIVFGRNRKVVWKSTRSAATLVHGSASRTPAYAGGDHAGKSRQIQLPIAEAAKVMAVSTSAVSHEEATPQLDREGGVSGDRDIAIRELGASVEVADLITE